MLMVRLTLLSGHSVGVFGNGLEIKHFLVTWPFNLIAITSSCLPALGSSSRSSLLPSCRRTSGQSAASGHRWTSCISRGPVQPWPRLSGPPGATWSRRIRSRAGGATSWTLASGGTCLEKTPCRVRLESTVKSRAPLPQVSVPANFLLSPVLVAMDTNQVPPPSWTCCGPKTDSDCSASATPPPPSLPTRQPTRPHLPLQGYLPPTVALQCPLVSSRRHWPCGETPRAARRPSDPLRRSPANRPDMSCT